MDKHAQSLHKRHFFEMQLIELLIYIEENEKEVVMSRERLNKTIGKKEVARREIQIIETLLDRENKLTEPEKVDPEGYRAYLRFLLVQKITRKRPWISTALTQIHAQLAEIRTTTESSE